MSRSRSQTGKSDHQIDLFAEDIAAETPTIPAAGDTTFAIKDLITNTDLIPSFGLKITHDESFLPDARPMPKLSKMTIPAPTEIAISATLNAGQCQF